MKLAVCLYSLHMTKHRTKSPHIKPYNYKGSVFFRVSFQLNGHQVRKQGFASVEAAEEFYFQSRKEIREGTWIKSSVNLMANMKMDELYARYCRKVGFRRADATRRNGETSWRVHISPTLGKKTAKQVGKRTLALWVDHLREKGLSDNTIGVVKAEISNVLKMAYDYDLIDALPKFPKLYKKPAMKAMFKPADIHRILAAFTNPQYQVMAAVQYSLALRVGELLGLTPGDVNFAEGTILINKQMARQDRGKPWSERLKPTKNKISRALPLTPELADALKPYVECRNSDAPLWISSYLEPVSEMAYITALKGAAERAGFTKPISSHCLRASMLDYLVNHSGLNIHAVAWLGRHSAKVLVSRYSQPDLEQLSRIYHQKMAKAAVLSCKSTALEMRDVD